MTLERFLILAVLGLLVWLPVPGGSYAGWATALYVAAVGGLLLIWGGSLALGRVQRHWRPLRQAGVMIAFLLLTQAWVGWQLYAGLTQNPGRSVEYALTGLAHTGLFALILALFTTRKRLNLLLGVLVAVGTLHAFYAAALTLLPDSGGAVSGTYQNRNHFAGYLEMTLAAGIGLLLALRDDRDFHWRDLAEWFIGPKARIRLALIIMVVALVMTRSRMGNIAFFSSLIIMGGLFVLVTPKHRLRNGLILASILVIDLLVISHWFGLEALQQRLAETQLRDRVELVEGADGIARETVVARNNIIRDDLNVYLRRQIEARPWSGYGAGSFETTFQRYPGRDVPGRANDAHNDYGQFVIEYGLIGVLPLAGFVVLAFWRGLQPVWRRRSLYRSGVGLGACIGILSLMIHSATDSNLQMPANAALFITLAAVAALAQSHARPLSLSN